MILHGDCIDRMRKFPKNSIDCCVTSPPYWGLRDYGFEGQLGQEPTPEEYVQSIVKVFQQVKRVLRPEGTLWLNLGDSYSGSGKGSYSDGAVRKSGPKQKTSEGTQIGKFSRSKSGLKDKDLVGIPWRVAFALQADGWYLRQDIIWHKPNVMPESVRDRCTKSHEYIFLFSKSPKYYFDYEAIKEPTTHAHEAKYDNGLNGHQGGVSHEGQGTTTRKFAKDPTKRNKRSVWTVNTKPFKGAHFATFPPDLIEPCILAGSRTGRWVLDPFFGAGTIGLVAAKHGRKFIGIEMNEEYVNLAKARLGTE